MSLYQITPEDRPNREQDKSKKGEEYHCKMGRWALGSTSMAQIGRLHEKYATAERAYNGRIITQSDIDTFMRDDHNNVRNRTFFNFNMLRMLVEQYRGSLIQMRFNAGVQPVTRRTETRRQADLSRHMLMHSAGQHSDNLKRVVGSRYNIGNTEQESFGKWKSSFKDKHLMAMQHSMERLVAINKMDRYAGDDGMRFCFGGVLVSKMTTEGSYPRDRRVHPCNFIYDTSQDEVDFSDCMYLGTHTLTDLGELAENYRIDRETIRYVDEMLRLNTATGWAMAFNGQTPSPRLRNYSMHWRDLAYSEFGFINGPGDVPTLVRVGEDDDGNAPKYTRNDLITPPKNRENDELFNGQRWCSRSYQCTRFVDMVPWENMVGGAGIGYDGKIGKYELADLVLDYGLYPLQEYNPFDPLQSVLPIKAQAFALADGEIITPVQAAIDPNRFMIRVLSAVENQINKAGSKGPVVDMDLIDPKVSPADIARKTSNGELLQVRAGGRGVAQALGTYDTTAGSGTYQMLGLIQVVEGIVRTVMGMPEPMTGEKPVKGQGNATTEMIIARGITALEPYYDGYSNWMLQKFQWLATAGKQWLCEHPDVCLDLMSSEEYSAYMLSEGVELERYNATIVRENPGDVKRQSLNDFLDFCMQLQIIPPKMYFDLRGSSMEDVTQAMKQYHEQLEMAEAQAARDQAKKDMEAGLAAMEQENEIARRETQTEQAATATSLAKIGAQAQANIEVEAAKAALAPKEQGPAAKAAPAKKS